ncbi:MAG: hypothetical protein AAF471_07150, partial [Myxococcota bacterium]
WYESVLNASEGQTKNPCPCSEAGVTTFRRDDKPTCRVVVDSPLRGFPKRVRGRQIAKVSFRHPARA